MIVLDTHILIWFVQGEDKLGRKAREIVEQSFDQEEVTVSAITFWEISLLAHRGNISLAKPTQTWIDDLRDRGLGVIGISPEIAVDAGQLADNIHGDPVDRLIIASARATGFPLVTADRSILAYGQAGHVTVIDGRY